MEFRGPSDWSSLHRAVWNHDFTEVESLAHSGNLNVTDAQGWTPLHLACASETSMLFYSHQIISRGYSKQPSYINNANTRAYAALEWGPKRMKSTFSSEDNERAASMRVLEILLQHKVDLHERAQGFCTPLHCAANSGWLSHVLALIKAGAKVYTGPQCSPLCWVQGGSGGTHPVARYLRVELSDWGLTMIEQDHARDSGRPYERSFLRDEEPLFKTQKGLEINENGLCSVCEEMTVESFVTRLGFQHLSFFNDIRESARRCKFCKVIIDTLAELKQRSTEIQGQVWIGTTYRGQPIDSLNIKLSGGCRCDSSISYPSPDFSKCRGDCNVLHTGQIVIFTGKDMSECMYRVQQGSEVMASLQSTGAFRFMRDRLKICDQTHPECKIQGLHDAIRPELPLRVIDVSKVDSMGVRLVDGTGRFENYAAFSHRWVGGPTPAWATRRRTLLKRRDWFQVNQLPASIMDAIKTTHLLGLDYVWIDSVCIIQDSSDDWNNEASKMADVYAKAYVTLFADSAADDAHSFLQPRKTFPSTPITIKGETNTPITIRIRNAAEDGSRYPKGALFEQDTQIASYLSKRAWILQEQLLSKRKLHFGKHQVYWVCRHGVIAEDGQVSAIRNVALYETYLFESTEITEPEIGIAWGKVIERYSSLDLTFKEDKLPALSGIANVVSKNLNSDYICGIWKRSFAIGLAWYIPIKDPNDKSSRPEKYRAPSFSWACVDDAISMMKFEDKSSRNFPDSIGLPKFPDTIGLPNFLDTIEITLIDSDIALEGMDPFGKVRGGKIIVCGPMCKAISLGPYPQALSDTDKGYNPVYDMGMTPVGSMWADASDDIPYGEITCLKLFGGFKDVFLVLVPLDTKDENCLTYRRVGLGDTILWGRSQYGTEKFFDGAEKCTITLV